MRENVIADSYLRSKTEAGALNAADYFRLALADEAARLLPQAMVYTSAQHQGVSLPAAFVHIFDILSSARLGGAIELDFGAEVTYIPTDETATDERLDAAMTVLTDLARDIVTDIGIFRLTDFSFSVADGRAQILCRSKATLIDPSTEMLMQNLEQGVDLNG